MSYFDTEDRPDVRPIAVQRRRARTAKTCDDCHRPIEPGASYYRRTFNVDGAFVLVVSHCPYVGACVPDPDAFDAIRREEAETYPG